MIVAMRREAEIHGMALPHLDQPGHLGMNRQKLMRAWPVERNENRSSVSSTRDLNFCSVLTTCVECRPIRQVTVAPTGTDVVLARS
jgi:hypothetical protein